MNRCTPACLSSPTRPTESSALNTIPLIRKEKANLWEYVKHRRKRGALAAAPRPLAGGLLAGAPSVSRSKNPVQGGLRQGGFVDFYARVTCPSLNPHRVLAPGLGTRG